ncbi:MAG: 6-carboxytetrahydropterin synthase [Bryobacteraceae bacterium]
MTSRLTRQYRFSASHRLHSPALSAEANSETYGKCNNPFGHGHDYVLQVCVAGPIDRETGLIADIRAVDRIVEENALRLFRDTNLNDLPAFSAVVPTTENLALLADDLIRRAWPASLAPLAGVRILETRRNTFETSGIRS